MRVHPRHFVNEDDLAANGHPLEKPLQLEERLKQRIVGQDEAVEAVSDAVLRARAGLKDQRRPTASFIFLGPTGVYRRADRYL